MKHTFVRAIAAGFAAAVLLSLGRFSALCGEIRSEVVRLHVLANSDSEEDQTLKLQVRDAVLAAADGLMNGVTDTDTALRVTQDQLPQLQAAAQQCVWQNGYHYPVTVSLCEMYFTTRTYSAGTLPAGWYNALRVQIGTGEGQNWWCVVFPSLCVPAATEQVEDVAVGAGFSDNLSGAITGKQEYQVRFFLLDFLGQVENFFCQMK